LSFFNQKAIEVGNETVVNFEKMIKHMTYHIIPWCAVMYQQCYMLGGLRKPKNMTTCKFCNCLTELNTYLALFPNDQFDEEGVPAGFSEDQKIPKHLLVNVIYFSLPKTWLTTMTMHGFDYVECNDPKGDLIKFCEERIEVLEHEQPAAKKARAEACRAAKATLKTWLTTLTMHGFDYVECNDPKGDLIKFCEERIEVLEHEQPAAKKARACRAAKATLKSPPSASKGNSKVTTNNKHKFDVTKVCRIHGPGHVRSFRPISKASRNSARRPNLLWNRQNYKRCSIHF
jgi:hypothetical protein